MEPLTYTDQKIGLKIKIFRKSVKYTQKQLAKKLGISTYQLQKYEKGMNRIGVKMLYHLSLIANLPMEWFVEDVVSIDLVAK